MYEEARNFINGTGGYPKKVNKGLKIMKEAALINEAASCYYGVFSAEQKKYAIAYECLSRFDEVKKIAADDYCKCMYYMAKKKAKDPAALEGFLNDVEFVRSSITGEGFYYAALIRRIAKQPVEAVNEELKLAAFCGSVDMPDYEYAACGRERGVYYGEEEFRAIIGARDDDDKTFGGFYPCEKTKEQALKIAKANLDEKRIKEILPFGASLALANADMDAVLEYQKVYRVIISVGKYDARYEYNHPNYSTVTSGSASLQIDMNWRRYYATYQHHIPQVDLFKTFNEMTPGNVCNPDAQFRVVNSYDSYIAQVCDEKVVADIEAGCKYKFKQALIEQNNWEGKYIKVTTNDKEIQSHTLKEFYVPFWFFTKKILGISITLRVNATTGEVDAFVGNPSGRFAQEDNMAVGAYQTLLDKKGKPMKRKHYV